MEYNQTLYTCQRWKIEGRTPQQNQLELWQDTTKKQNMKENVTITEEQIDINTKSWCSFTIRAKNQTFFKTAQHKPHTRYKKQLRDIELKVAADNVSSKCKPKLQMFFTQVCRPLNCHYVSFPFSLTYWCYFCESVFVHCDFVYDLFYFEVCVWFLFCCKPCSLHLLKYPPQLLSESSSVLWVFVYFSVVPFFFMHFSCCRFSHISRFSLSSTRVWFSVDIIFYFGMLVYLPYLKVLC